MQNSYVIAIKHKKNTCQYNISTKLGKIVTYLEPSHFPSYSTIAEQKVMLLSMHALPTLKLQSWYDTWYNKACLLTFHLSQ